MVTDMTKHMHDGGDLAEALRRVMERKGK